MLAIGLIILGVVSVIIYHPQNFTAVIAVALFAGTYLSRKQAIAVPLGLFIIKDMFIGFHALIFFTWGSIVVIALMGMRMRSKRNFKSIALTSLGAAVFYYIITNFGVWLFYSTYPKSLLGLAECYIVAIPYFRGTLVSTILYTALLFGIYEYAALKLKNTRLANVL